MRKAFEDHYLTTTCDTPDVKVFYMRQPETRAFAVQLAFTPEGIHITGDVALGRDRSGVGTSVGCGKTLGWFCGELSEGYLCEKFLTKQFQQDAAVEDARNNAEEYARQANDESWDDEERTRCTRLAGQWLTFALELERCDDDFDAHQCAMEAYNDIDDSDSFEGLGYDYPRTDAGWLCAIQKKFAELYARQQETT